MIDSRVILLILDGCGVGATPDANTYGDAGASTLPNLASHIGQLSLPTLARLGLGNIASIKGVPPHSEPAAAFGEMYPRSAGKDSTSGHWEICGCTLSEPFPVYPEGFPEELVARFESAAGVKTIGNRTASGTQIIEELGERHLKSGEIILYTSADSVWQMAMHEDLYPLQRQYELCRLARKMLQGQHAVGRVIARPFAGRSGVFERTSARRDFSLEPTDPTILDRLVTDGRKVLAIGKTWDLMAGRGFTDRVKTENNDEIMTELRRFVTDRQDFGLAFANLVDFDMLWGHRRDPEGMARGLEAFDRWLSEFIKRLNDQDILIITADHGCDPTHQAHTDHTREYVPLLVHGPRLASGVDLGTRSGFADIAATIAGIFGFEERYNGTSFRADLGGTGGDHE